MKPATTASAHALGLSGSGRGASTGLVLALLLLTAWPLSGLAHQQKTAVTRLVFNASSGNFEVMHRLFLHDAEHAASVVFGEKQDMIESEESRTLFGSYVANRFAVAAESRAGELAPLQFDYLGEEIDGQYLWIYQEAVGYAASLPEDLEGLRVVNSILRDVWPDQSNLVNVEREGRIESVSFTGGADSLRVRLP